MHENWNKELPEWVEQPETTYTGYPITPVKFGLPKEIDSLCPECGKVIKALLYPEGGKVWIKKKCEEHGEFLDIFYGDEELYYKCEEFWFGDSRGVENPQIPNATKCPLQCGLCNMHLSCSALPVIDLTNRCNLSCPVCFANANATGYLYEPSYDDVVRMLETLINQKPVPANRVQFSGGEPTLRPDFLKIVQKAKEMGFYYIQVNTNGIKMADLEFAQAAKEAGVHTLYLQFDGVTEDVYYKTRNLPLLEYKMKTIENCRKVGISIVFVPTVVKGFNDHQVGEIVKLAAKNVDIVSGIAFQPVSFVGRYSHSYRMERRYTMADLAFDIEKQTGYMKARRDWYPLACTAILSRFVGKIKGTTPFTVSTHPHCSQGTFFFVDKKTKEVKSVGEFIDMDRFLKKVAQMYKKASTKTFDLVSNLDDWNELQDCFKPERAPSDMTFIDLLRTLDGYENTELRRTTEKGKEHGYPHFFAAGMHFMDPYNFSVERVMRCVIHYVDPKGRLYPFCAYNGGPTYRKRVENTFKLPDEVVKKKIIEENYPRELSRLAKKLGL
jgi:uncharacterized radical SAM superfamily Fe-S cluster-containing enzyme